MRHGGGAVLVAASGAVQLDGKISVNGIGTGTHRDGGIQGVLDIQPHGKLATSWADLKSEPTRSAR